MLSINTPYQRQFSVNQFSAFGSDKNKNVYKIKIAAITIIAIMMRYCHTSTK